MNSDTKIARFKQFLQTDPNNINLVCDLLELYLTSGLFEEGVSFFKELDDELCSNPYICIRASNLQIALGHYQEAIEELLPFINEKSIEPTIAYNLSYCYFCLQQFTNAKELLTKVCSQWQQIPNSLLLLARCNHHLGVLEIALEQVDEYLTVFNEDKEAMGLRSLLLVDLGMDEEVTLLYQSGGLDYLQSLESAIAYSSACISIHQVDSAIEATDNALKHFPKIGRLWSNRAQLDMLRLDWPAVLKSLERATTYMPNHIGTWHLLAWTLIIEQRLSEAMMALNKAKELDRNFADTYGGMAVINVYQDDYDEAKRNIKRAAGLDKNSVPGLYAQALLFERVGELAKAEDIMTKISKLASFQNSQNYLPFVLQQLKDKH